MSTRKTPVETLQVEEYRRAKGQPTGEQLVKLLQDSPLGDVDMDRERIRERVRDVKL